MIKKFNEFMNSDFVFESEEIWKQGVYELITQRGLWTDENEQTICFYSKLDDLKDCNGIQLDPFQRGCSLILLSKKLGRNGLPIDGYTWIMIKPQYKSNNAFDDVVKSFNGKLVETIQGENDLQFAQRGHVNTTTEVSYSIDIYTFNPKDIDMKKLQRTSNQNHVYVIPKVAPTGMAAFDKKYYFNPFNKLFVL